MNQPAGENLQPKFRIKLPTVGIKEVTEKFYSF